MSVNVANETIQRHGFSVEEVARRYGVSAGLVRLEIARGKLKCAHIGRRVVLSQRSIDAWLDSAEGGDGR